MGALIKPFFFKSRYTVDSATDKPRWSVIQVASCRLLHSGDSLADAKTAASSNGPSLFQGIRVLTARHSLLPVEFTGPPPVISTPGHLQLSEQLPFFPPGLFHPS